MQYDFSDFDDGKEFVNPSHLYTLDLDVFGEHSLFQYINRTATPIGKLHLANWFNAHLENKEAIEHRQEAIHELSTDLEYRQQIRLLGLLYKGKPCRYHRNQRMGSQSELLSKTYAPAYPPNSGYRH